MACHDHCKNLLANAGRYILVGFLLATTVLLFSCESEKTEPGLSEQDAAIFLGRWAGTYKCPRLRAQPDTMIIARGDSALKFSITIHANSINPDIVTGKLNKINEILIPEQTMGGVPGKARITIANDIITYSQTGFDVTCMGTDYHRF